jgi:hypothetical protein
MIKNRIKIKINVRTPKEGYSMTKKTVPFNQKGIEKLPDNKPVVYKILTEGGKNNYTGVAQRGRVQERLQEHLPGGKDYVPGAKVQIEQMPSIKEAEMKESRIISPLGGNRRNYEETMRPEAIIRTYITKFVLAPTKNSIGSGNNQH